MLSKSTVPQAAVRQDTLQALTRKHNVYMCNTSTLQWNMSNIQNENKLQYKLEKVAINDVLPLKAARRIANL